MVNNYSKRFAAWVTGWWERCANRLLKAIFAREILASQKLFISNVAHELRTPLSTIKTSTEVALIDTGLSRDARLTFEEILGELERVSEILNNLLSLNTLTRPERMLFRSLDLLPLAEETLARHKLLARERGIRLRLKAQPGSIAWANPTAVGQIMGNVVKNALLYTRENSGGAVTVAVRPAVVPEGSTPMILFEVEDIGIGMGPEDLAHIFEPFYRADISRTRLIKKTGSGLGLTIVNEMTRAMGGSVEVHSKKGSGTIVSVLLPAGGWQRADLPAQTDSPAIQGASDTLVSMQKGTAIWSPIRAAVTFLRGW